MSRGLNLATYCASGAIFHNIVTETQSKVFPSDKVLSALVTNMTRRVMVMMLPKNLLSCAALVLYVEQAMVVEQAIATVRPVPTVEFHLFLGNHPVISWLYSETPQCQTCLLRHVVRALEFSNQVL